MYCYGSWFAGKVSNIAAAALIHVNVKTWIGPPDGIWIQRVLGDHLEPRPINERTRVWGDLSLQELPSPSEVAMFGSHVPRCLYEPCSAAAIGFVQSHERGVP